MTTSNKYQPSGSNQVFTIKPGRENILELNEVGSLREINDAVLCVGESTHVGNALHTNVVQISTYKIITRPETFLIKDNSIEVSSEHLRLECDPAEGGCSTGSSTFIWSHEKTNCNLEKIRIFHPTKVMKTYLLDSEARILLNITGYTRLPECEDVELMKTGYEDVYVADAQKSKGLPDLRPADLELSTDYSMRDDYAMFAMESMLGSMETRVREEACKHEISGQNGRIFPVGEHQGMIRGGRLYIFDCEWETKKIAETSTCYADVPLATDPMSFADPITLIMKAHSVAEPCSKRFPMAIQTVSGWVEIKPHLSPVSPPLEGEPMMPSTIKHTDLHSGGLYTDEEKRSWQSLLSFPSFHTALLKSFSWGVCKHQADCQTDHISSRGVSSYDINKLIPDLKNLDPWEQLKQYINAYGAYLSFAVLAIYAVRILIQIVVLSMTIVKEGPNAFLALLFLTCCSQQNAYRKIQRRNRRQRVEENEENPQMIPMMNTPMTSAPRAYPTPGTSATTTYPPELIPGVRRLPMLTTIPASTDKHLA